ncbi:Hypothetical predicted protein, partial [Olea europaea subsp. europaea]
SVGVTLLLWFREDAGVRDAAVVVWAALLGSMKTPVLWWYSCGDGVVGGVVRFYEDTSTVVVFVWLQCCGQPMEVMVLVWWIWRFEWGFVEMTVNLLLW